MKKFCLLILTTVLLGFQAAIGQQCNVNFSNYVYGDSSIHTYLSTQNDTNVVYDWTIVSQTNDTVYQSNSHAGYVITHTLPSGIYQVCVSEYYHNIFCGDTCKYDTITQHTTCNLNPYFYYTLSGDTVHYVCLDTNSQAHHFLNMGNGSYVSGTTGQYVYTQPGSYHVCMYVYIPGTNCSDSFCRTIGVTVLNPDSCQGLSAHWSVIHQSGDTVQFSAEDTVSGDHRYWNYGDGTTSYGICGCHPVDPIHVFPGPGTYHVCLLNYRPGVNCGVDSSCQTIVIAPVDTNTACANLSLAWNYSINGDTLNFHFCFYSQSGTCNDSLCQDVIVISTLILHLDALDLGSNSVQLFPNPFTQYTTIKINGFLPPFNLNVYDTEGQLVRQQTMTNNLFNVERGTLASGMYVFQIMEGSQMIGKGKMIAK